MLTIRNCVRFISDREACAIPDPDNEEVVITGGSTKKRVSVYNKAGHQRDLADLNTGRRAHACSGFTYGEKKVIIKVIVFIIVNLKIFMVAGGYGSTTLDTTEVYQDNDWRTVSGILPRAMAGMAAGSINDKIILFGINHFICGLIFIFKTLGGSDGYGNFYGNNILEYNPGTEQWQDIGTMKEARGYHAVTIVSLIDYAAWCE